MACFLDYRGDYIGYIRKMLNNYKNVFVTLLDLGNTIVAYTTIGGASNVEKNFFLYERI